MLKTLVRYRTCWRVEVSVEKVEDETDAKLQESNYEMSAAFRLARVGV